MKNTVRLKELLVNRRFYHFRSPLTIHIQADDDGVDAGVTIAWCEELGVLGEGTSEQSAMTDWHDRFDQRYQRYANANAGDLDQHEVRRRQRFLDVVIAVEPTP